MLVLFCVCCYAVVCSLGGWLGVCYFALVLWAIALTLGCCFALVMICFGFVCFVSLRGLVGLVVVDSI